MTRATQEGVGPGAMSGTLSLTERLAGRGRPLVLDGATGTELERAGLATGLPLWSTHALLEAPEVVGRVHASHLEAGAEIATANTFRTQRRTLARAGMTDADSDRRLTRLAVALARTAADRAPHPCWVAGSLAPLEDCYRPELVPSSDELEHEHARQAELLAESGVDLIVIETMNTRREAMAAASAAARTGLPFVVGFVAWSGARLLSGEALDESARAVAGIGALAVGVNCLPPANLEPCRRALAALSLPLLVSPNLGEPEPERGFTRDSRSSPEAFADAFLPWLASGSTALVGGCCGTTPRHIARLAALAVADARPGSSRN